MHLCALVHWGQDMLPPELSPLASTVAEIIALGIFIITAAALLGYLSDSTFGALIASMLSLVAASVCLGGYIGFARIGYFSFSPPSNPAGRLARSESWAMIGLLIAVMLVGGLGALLGKKLGGSESGKRRGAIFLPALWFGFCFACWISHRAGTWVGLLTIAIPTVMIFWLSLYYLAHFTLPLNEDQSIWMAFRCLLTFSAGTNYPYYAIEEREKVERVPGNQAGALFAGPGIFLAGPDHVVAISNNLKLTGVRGPGVVFTRQWEFIQEPMDLRVQQRAFEVQAITKDGIRVRATAFGPFQLSTAAKRPTLGRSFPFHASSVARAFCSRLVDIKRSKNQSKIVEERRQRRWDELYMIVGTHVVQDIIASYRFNELCEPLELEKDPRSRIAEEYRRRMNEELDAYGIDILGGGIGNLLPVDEEPVFKRRIKNWQIRWQRKALEQLGVAEADAERLIGQAHAEVQAKMIQTIGEAIAEIATDDREVIFSTVALRFVESLNQMVTQSQLRDRLPLGVISAMENLPHIIGGTLGGQDG